MKRLHLITLLLAVCAGCQSVGDVLLIGEDTYTVSSHVSGYPIGLPWPEVKALNIRRANEFCESKNKTMTVVKWETHGIRSLTLGQDAELTFRCL